MTTETTVRPREEPDETGSAGKTSVEIRYEWARTVVEQRRIAHERSIPEEIL